MDGTVVSAMRTGAVTGVALRHLADPDAEVACLLGAGVLAHTQLAALRAVLPRLREVRVFDPAAERCSRFCASARAPAAARRAAGGVGRDGGARRRGGGAGDDGGRAELRRRVDRPGRDRRARLEPGRPLDLQAATDLLVVDDWEHESTHPGRYAERLVAAGLVAADGSQAVELADVVAGARPGRTEAAQRIVVTPVGLAMDDVAAGWHVLRVARARGLGTPLRLRSGPPVWE